MSDKLQFVDVLIKDFLEFQTPLREDHDKLKFIGH